MKYNSATKPSDLETNALGVDLDTALLQVRDNSNCGYDEAPDNAIFWSIEFASKSLSSMVNDTFI